MHRPKALLPPVTSRSNYEAIRINPNIWPQAMRVICQRHGLPTERLKRFGDGLHPATPLPSPELDTRSVRETALFDL